MSTCTRRPGLLLTLLIASLLQSPVCSQNSYKGKVQAFRTPGYIITFEGKTNYGKISILEKFKGYPVKILFYGNDGSEKVFTAPMLKGMGVCHEVVPDPESEASYTFWDDYLTRQNPDLGEQLMMNRLATGRITVFQDGQARIIKSEPHCGKAIGLGFGHRDSDDEEEEEDDIPVYLTRSTEMEGVCAYTGYYVEKDGLGPVHVDKNNLAVHWSWLFGDCEAMKVETAENPKLLKFKKFMQAVAAYNSACGEGGTGAPDGATSPP